MTLPAATANSRRHRSRRWRRYPRHFVFGLGAIGVGLAVDLSIDKVLVEADRGSAAWARWATSSPSAGWRGRRWPLLCTGRRVDRGPPRPPMTPTDNPGPSRVEPCADGSPPTTPGRPKGPEARPSWPAAMCTVSAASTAWFSCGLLLAHAPVTEQRSPRHPRLIVREHLFRRREHVPSTCLGHVVGVNTLAKSARAGFKRTYSNMLLPRDQGRRTWGPRWGIAAGQRRQLSGLGGSNLSHRPC